ncbi:MAG: hypothetical protein ACMUEM_02340 [Flavobacteriales bacterium AspAUS03]
MHMRLRLSTALIMKLIMFLFISTMIGLISLIILMIINQAKDLSLLNNTTTQIKRHQRIYFINAWLKGYGIHLFTDLDRIKIF